MKQKFILFLPGYLKAQVIWSRKEGRVFFGMHVFGVEAYLRQHLHRKHASRKKHSYTHIRIHMDKRNRNTCVLYIYMCICMYTHA